MVQDRPKARRRASGVVVPNQPRWFQRLGAFIIFCSMRAYVFSLRIRWDDSGNPRDQINGPTIYCLWHNRLILCTAAYQQHAKEHRMGKGMAGLISASKDGAFLAAILARFKVHPVRGSSSRRGPQALLELTSWAERGYDLAITPDGPRGPKYIVQQGAMSLGQLTGLPIVPFGFHAHWKIQLKSWDAFQIPLPFSRCIFRMGAPVRVPRDATDAQREEIRLQLEQTLKKISVD
jgi:lysophospholipid acyltransferase (LPLAT)-like uncharacterized protein